LSHFGIKVNLAVCWSVIGSVSSGPGVSVEITDVETAVPSVAEVAGRAAVKVAPEKRHMMRTLNSFMMEEV
jgi:hypothetical protein